MLVREAARESCPPLIAVSTATTTHHAAANAMSQTNKRTPAIPRGWRASKAVAPGEPGSVHQALPG